MSFAEMSVLELRAGYRVAAFSPVEVLAEQAERIELVEPRLNAFVTLALDAAADEAVAAEREYARGGDRPLLGIPFAAKDLFDTAGVRTTYGSAMFASRVPTVDAEAVTRMRQAGAILVGKTATHEFGWGITCANPHFGPTRNPWGADRIPGGSSGGSAAAVAAGVVPLALGTDTAGSTRIPASFCGIVGLKPTFGLVDTRGQFPLAPSFDHVGVLARMPGDARIALDVLAQGPTRAETPRARSIAVCPDLHGAPLAADVEDALAATIDVLTNLGADVGEASVPGAASPYETFATIQLYEALKVHRAWQLYPERRSEYGQDVRERLDLAASVDEHAHRAASEQRRALADSFDRLFRDVDMLLVPTAAITAPPLDNAETLPLRELVLPYTAPMNLLGLPACALRAGFDGDGMPVGVQLVGSRGSDCRVLALAARLYEATRDTQERQPPNVRTSGVA